MLKYRNKDFPSTLPYIAFSGRNITVFGCCQVFDGSILLRIFFNTMHFILGLGKESQS